MKRVFILKSLSKDDTTFYKGLAILMIVFHNFLHWTQPKPGENEMSFSVNRVQEFIDISLTSPEYIGQILFSFWGHFGVQVFLFLSAYGITISYSKTKDAYWKYSIKRFTKIYPAFIVSIVFYFIYYFICHPNINTIISKLDKELIFIIQKLTLISNFIPGEIFRMNGPWWFVSLIIQFYLIFPGIYVLTKKYGNVVLLSISIISLVFIYFLDTHIKFPVLGTVLGHFPEFCLGIYLALKKSIRFNSLEVIIIYLVFLLSNFFKFIWPLGFISVLILLLFVFQNLKSKVNITINRFLLFIGSISMYMFYLNGFMRVPWIHKVGDQWYSNWYYLIIFLLILIPVSYIFTKIEQKIRSLI